jgi:hypothetical protein
MESKM